jgi:hypothetical protein
MISFDSVVYFANHYLQIYSYIDCAEIIFFIYVTFTVSSWLNQDHTKPLLLSFYSYFTLLFGAYFFQLATVYHLMLVTAPIYFILLIVHHQKNLQKNFIVAKHKPIAPTKVSHKEWVETLIRSCLIASHHKKNITCVIEQSDSLETLVNKPFRLDIPIQKHIIDMLLESSSYDITKLVLADRYGTIISINATWSDVIINELIFHQMPELQLAQEYAKMVTSKTDAIIIHINHQQIHHFIAHQGTIIHDVTIDQALKMIKNILYQKDKDISLSQGINHDSNKSDSISSFYKN